MKKRSNREIQNYIRMKREEKNWSQEMLATEAKINSKYYGRIERGESSPTIGVLYKICKVLDIKEIPISYLKEK